MRAPVATITMSAPYSSTAFASSRVPVITSTFFELVQLDLAVVGHPRPLTEARKLRHPADLPADVGGRVDEVHPAHAALAQHERALHPGGAGADHQHIVVGVCRRLEPLGVPAAAVLLAGGRVLGADHRRAADLPARDADVAADALADVVEAALVDLLRQERVGDRRPRSADDVELAALDRSRPSCPGW